MTARRCVRSGACVTDRGWEHVLPQRRPRVASRGSIPVCARIPKLVASEVEMGQPVAVAESSVPPPITDDAERARIQRRTIRTLLASQVCGGVGQVSGIAITVLLANDLTGSKTVAGLTAACLSIGGTAVSFPLAKLMSNHGRRPG